MAFLMGQTLASIHPESRVGRGFGSPGQRRWLERAKKHSRHSSLNDRTWKRVIEEVVTRVGEAMDVVRRFSIAGLEMRWQIRVSFF